jgi:sigma-B regulation protein RsbU (phosphoserine phosphatase)
MERRQFMPSEGDLIETLTKLNRIAENLNRAVDGREVLNRALADLVELMGLETAWISLRDPANEANPGGGKWVLAAHHNLPPALAPENASAWEGPCSCRTMCEEGRLNAAYNEVKCSRLRGAGRDGGGLAVHATAPLCSGEHILGLLNVAAPDWQSFSPKALSLLTNVGSQLGAALERAWLYDLLRAQRNQEQKALLDLSQQLLGRLDLDGLIDTLVQEVRQILYADACALLLPSKQPGLLDFQASSGWHSDPASEGRQVPADDRTRPGLVMRTQRALQVENLQQEDPTMSTPDWLKAEGFCGHAVVPLLINGRSVGVLMIDHREPRLLGEDELRSLQLMANQAAIAIETARLHEEEVKVQAMEKELEIGRKIQLSLLPEAPSGIPGWEFAAYYEAAREVGGDFYDFFPLSPSSPALGLVIADVTGKGVPAALFMVQASTTIRTTAQTQMGPSETLRLVNQMLLQDRRPAVHVTAVYAVLDTQTGRMVYTNAGHNRPLWVEAETGRCQELNGQGVILGALDETELASYGIVLEERQIDLQAGDLVVFYTDGVTEARNGEDELFGAARLLSAVEAQAGAGAQAVLEAIVTEVQAFAGDAPQSDDLTLFVVRYLPEAGGRGGGAPAP